MSFLCSCTRRRKRSESEDRQQEYYRPRSSSRSPPLAPASALSPSAITSPPLATPQVKRKFPTGIATTPSVPSDLEENASTAVAKLSKDSKRKDASAKSKDVKGKESPKAKSKDVKGRESPKGKGKENKAKELASKTKEVNKKDGIKFAPGAAKPLQTPVAEKRSFGTMTAPGAGEVTGYEQTILPRVRKKSTPVLAAKMEVTLTSNTKQTGNYHFDAGSSGSDTPRGYEGSISSSDAASGSPRDACTQCAFSDFSDDESSLLSLGKEEDVYENTVSDLRDPSADPGANSETWDAEFLQHDRIWMDVKSTLMDLISDKDSEAFQELQESMKPPDLTYCTVFRKMDGSLTHKAREDSKKVARHTFGGVPAEKVSSGSRSRLNLVALKDQSDMDVRKTKRQSKGEDEMDYEDAWTPGSDFEDKLFTPDTEGSRFDFGSESLMPWSPTLRSESELTLRSFQGGTMSDSPATVRSHGSGSSSRTLVMTEVTETMVKGSIPNKDRSSDQITEYKLKQSTEIVPSAPILPKSVGIVKEKVSHVSKSDTPLEEDVPVEKVGLVTNVEEPTEVRMRQKVVSTTFERRESLHSAHAVREGTPIVQDLKAQKELWRQGVAFDGKDFDISDADLDAMDIDSMELETIDTDKSRHHPKRVTRRKDTAPLRSFSLDYEKRSPQVVRKRPGKPIMTQPYSSPRTSQSASKDHSRHKLKLKREDCIDDDNISIEPPCSELLSPVEIVAKSVVATKDQGRKDKDTEKMDAVESATGLRSPGVVRGIIAATKKTDVDQAKSKSVSEDTETLDPNLSRVKSVVDNLTASLAGKCEQIGQTASKIPKALFTDGKAESKIDDSKQRKDSVDDSSSRRSSTDSAKNIPYSKIPRAVSSDSNSDTDNAKKNINPKKDEKKKDQRKDQKKSGNKPEKSKNDHKQMSEITTVQNIDGQENVKAAEETQMPRSNDLLTSESEEIVKSAPSNVSRIGRLILPGTPKKSERLEKLKQQTSLPEVSPESRFISKPSEIKRIGKIELFIPPPEDDDKKNRKPKRTRNVGRFLPKGGIDSLSDSPSPRESKEVESAPSASEVETINSKDVSLEEDPSVQRTLSEGSTTEPDIVTTHGSPHTSVDAQFLKFGSSFDEMSKGSPDVIVQCFSESPMTISVEEKSSEISNISLFDDNYSRDGKLGKSTIFSMGSTSVETVIPTDNRSVDSTNIEDAEYKASISIEQLDELENLTREEVSHLTKSSSLLDEAKQSVQIKAKGTSEITGDALEDIQSNIPGSAIPVKTSITGKCDDILKSGVDAFNDQQKKAEINIGQLPENIDHFDQNTRSALSDNRREAESEVKEIIEGTLDRVEVREIKSSESRDPFGDFIFSTQEIADQTITKSDEVMKNIAESVEKNTIETLTSLCDSFGSDGRDSYTEESFQVLAAKAHSPIQGRLSREIENLSSPTDKVQQDFDEILRQTSPTSFTDSVISSFTSLSRQSSSKPNHRKDSVDNKATPSEKDVANNDCDVAPVTKKKQEFSEQKSPSIDLGRFHISPVRTDISNKEKPEEASIVLKQTISDSILPRQLSDESDTSFSEENVPLLSADTSSPPEMFTPTKMETLSTSVTKDVVEVVQSSTKRISVGFDTVHQLPKIETSVEDTPLGQNQCPNSKQLPTRTPPVRLSDIHITGSVEEAIIELSKSGSSPLLDQNRKLDGSKSDIPSSTSNKEEEISETESILPASSIVTETLNNVSDTHEGFKPTVVGVVEKLTTEDSSKIRSPPPLPPVDFLSEENILKPSVDSSSIKTSTGIEALDQTVTPEESPNSLEKVIDSSSNIEKLTCESSAETGNIPMIKKQMQDVIKRTGEFVENERKEMERERTDNASGLIKEMTIDGEKQTAENLKSLIDTDNINSNQTLRLKTDENVSENKSIENSKNINAKKETVLKSEKETQDSSIQQSVDKPSKIDKKAKKSDNKDENFAKDAQEDKKSKKTEKKAKVKSNTSAEKSGTEGKVVKKKVSKKSQEEAEALAQAILERPKLKATRPSARLRAASKSSSVSPQDSIDKTSDSPQSVQQSDSSAPLVSESNSDMAASIQSATLTKSIAEKPLSEILTTEPVTDESVVDNSFRTKPDSFEPSEMQNKTFNILSVDSGIAANHEIPTEVGIREMSQSQNVIKAMSQEVSSTVKPTKLCDIDQVSGNNDITQEVSDTDESNKIKSQKDFPSNVDTTIPKDSSKSFDIFGKMSKKTPSIISQSSVEMSSDSTCETVPSKEKKKGFLKQKKSKSSASDSEGKSGDERDRGSKTESSMTPLVQKVGNIFSSVSSAVTSLFSDSESKKSDEEEKSSKRSEKRSEDIKNNVSQGMGSHIESSIIDTATSDSSKQYPLEISKCDVSNVAKDPPAKHTERERASEEKLPSDRDSLDGDKSATKDPSIDIIKSVSPRDSLEKELDQKASPLPSVNDSLEDARSGRDSVLTLDSLHRDSLEGAVVKDKSASPCDSLESVPNQLVSSEKTHVAKEEVQDTTKATPRDSLEGSPVKVIQSEGVTQHTPHVSVDEEKILNFSSILSPRMSFQRSADLFEESPALDTLSPRESIISQTSAEVTRPVGSSEENILSSAISSLPSPENVTKNTQKDNTGDNTVDKCLISKKEPKATTSQAIASRPILSPSSSQESGPKESIKPFPFKSRISLEDRSSISSASPRDSLSSKRDSSTTFSDSRLSTTDTSVIDEILGVSPLPKDWEKSPEDSPVHSPPKISLAVEESLSSSTSPRDSFELSSKQLQECAPKSPIENGKPMPFSPITTPRDSFDLEMARRISTDTLSSSVRGSFDSGGAPNMSQEEIAVQFERYFSSLDPTVVALRHSHMSSGSGGSRGSYGIGSGSDIDIVDFSEPSLMISTNLQENEIRSQQSQQTPSSTDTSATQTPRPEPVPTILSGDFDFSYIDTSSFERDATPIARAESEPSPTREVAKVMEELATVLANAEQGFDSDTGHGSRPESLREEIDPWDSKETVKFSNGKIDSFFELDSVIWTPREEEAMILNDSFSGEDDSFDALCDADREVFRRIAEGSKQTGKDLESCFDEMVDSIVSPRSSKVFEMNDNTEKKEAHQAKESEEGSIFPSGPELPDISDADTIGRQVDDVIGITTQSALEEKRKSPKWFQEENVKESTEPLLLETTSEILSYVGENPTMKPASVSNDSLASTRNDEITPEIPEIRESTFDVAKKVQEIIKSSACNQVKSEKPDQDSSYLRQGGDESKETVIKFGDQSEDSKDQKDLTKDTFSSPDNEENVDKPFNLEGELKTTDETIASKLPKKEAEALKVDRDKEEGTSTILIDFLKNKEKVTSEKQKQGLNLGIDKAKSETGSQKKEENISKSEVDVISPSETVTTLSEAKSLTKALILTADANVVSFENKTETMENQVAKEEINDVISPSNSQEVVSVQTSVLEKVESTSQEKRKLDQKLEKDTVNVDKDVLDSQPADGKEELLIPLCGEKTIDMNAHHLQGMCLTGDSSVAVSSGTLENSHLSSKLDHSICHGSFDVHSSTDDDDFIIEPIIDFDDLPMPTTECVIVAETMEAREPEVKQCINDTVPSIDVNDVKRESGSDDDFIIEPIVDLDFSENSSKIVPDKDNTLPPKDVFEEQNELKIEKQMDEVVTSDGASSEGNIVSTNGLKTDETSKYGISRDNIESDEEDFVIEPLVDLEPNSEKLKTDSSTSHTERTVTDHLVLSDETKDHGQSEKSINEVSPISTNEDNVNISQKKIDNLSKPSFILDDQLITKLEESHYKGAEIKFHDKRKAGDWSKSFSFESEKGQGVRLSKSFSQSSQSEKEIAEGSQEDEVPQKEESTSIVSNTTSDIICNERYTDVKTESEDTIFEGDSVRGKKDKNSRKSPISKSFNVGTNEDDSVKIGSQTDKLNMNTDGIQAPIEISQRENKCISKSRSVSEEEDIELSPEIIDKIVAFQHGHDSALDNDSLFKDLVHSKEKHCSSKQNDDENESLPSQLHHEIDPSIAELNVDVSFIQWSGPIRREKKSRKTIKTSTSRSVSIEDSDNIPSSDEKPETFVHETTSETTETQPEDIATERSKSKLKSKTVIKEDILDLCPSTSEDETKPKIERRPRSILKSSSREEVKTESVQALDSPLGEGDTSPSIRAQSKSSSSEGSPKTSPAIRDPLDPFFDRRSEVFSEDDVFEKERRSRKSKSSSREELRSVEIDASKGKRDSFEVCLSDTLSPRNSVKRSSTKSVSFEDEVFFEIVSSVDVQTDPVLEAHYIECHDEYDPVMEKPRKSKVERKKSPKKKSKAKDEEDSSMFKTDESEEVIVHKDVREVESEVTPPPNENTAHKSFTSPYCEDEDLEFRMHSCAVNDDFMVVPTIEVHDTEVEDKASKNKIERKKSPKKKSKSRDIQDSHIERSQSPVMFGNYIPSASEFEIKEAIETSDALSGTIERRKSPKKKTKSKGESVTIPVGTADEIPPVLESQIIDVDSELACSDNLKTGIERKKSPKHKSKQKHKHVGEPIIDPDSPALLQNVLEIPPSEIPEALIEEAKEGRETKIERRKSPKKSKSKKSEKNTTDEINTQNTQIPSPELDLIKEQQSKTDATVDFGAENLKTPEEKLLKSKIERKKSPKKSKSKHADRETVGNTSLAENREVISFDISEEGEERVPKVGVHTIFVGNVPSPPKSDSPVGPMTEEVQCSTVSSSSTQSTPIKSETSRSWVEASDISSKHPSDRAEDKHIVHSQESSTLPTRKQVKPDLGKSRQNVVLRKRAVPIPVSAPLRWSASLPENIDIFRELSKEIDTSNQKPSTKSKEDLSTSKETVHSAISIAKDLLRADLPVRRREKSKSPRRQSEAGTGSLKPDVVSPEEQSSSSRRRRARAKRRSVAPVSPSRRESGPIAPPLDWAAEVEAEIPLDPDEDAEYEITTDAPAEGRTSTSRRKRKRLRRRRAAAAAAVAAATTTATTTTATTAAEVPAAPDAKAAQATPLPPGGRFKRLKSCEEDAPSSTTATSTTSSSPPTTTAATTTTARRRPSSDRPLSPRSSWHRSGGSGDDDPTPWCVVRSRRLRRREQAAASQRPRSNEGIDGFRFQEPPTGVRLSSGSDGPAEVFYFAGAGQR